MPVTQADVAKRAGVSQRTVSNVVRGFPFVSAEVMARVTAAIAELGYTPSHVARTLRSGRSGVIQLVVPELDVPYFSELARALVKHAEERGFVVLIRQTLGDRAKERDALEGSAAEWVEGTILSPVAAIDELLPGGVPKTPVVLIGEHAGNGILDHVGIDDVGAAAAATSHMLRAGCRRVAFIGAHVDESLVMATMRLEGYKSALREAGIDFDPRLVVRTSSYHREDGRLAMSELLDSSDDIDGAFCATDLLALGALRAARDRGVRVPEDVAVVGFDGLEEGQFAAPTLSTVAPDKEALARVTVERLLAMISARTEAGDVWAPRDLRVDFELIVRQSSSTGR